MNDHHDTDLTDPHGEAEALRKENERLRLTLHHVIAERDGTFALMLTRAEAAEAALAAAPVAETATCLHLTADMAARCPTCNPGLPTAMPVPVIDRCSHGHVFAKLSDHPHKDGVARCPTCLADGLDMRQAALREQPDWKAMAERLGEALGLLAIATGTQDAGGKVRAALSDLAKMKGE